MNTNHQKSPHVSSHGQGKGTYISPEFDTKSLNSQKIVSHIEGLKKSVKQNRHPVTDDAHLYPFKNLGTPKRISSKTYVYGIFTWKIVGENALIDGICRDEFLELICKLGFRKRYQPDNSYRYIFEQDNVIKAVELPQIRDAIADLVKTTHNINIEYKGLCFQATAEVQKEIFLRNSPSLINDAVLGHLPNHIKPILRDGDDSMYFAFQNCFVKVTIGDVAVMDYSQLEDRCVWQDHMISRSFNKRQDYAQSKYAQFVMNVANNEDDRVNAFKSAIGYLLHNYSNPTTSRAVIAYDEQLSKINQPEGGSGKGIFNQALQQLRSVAVIDGKKLKPSNQFSYQQVTERTQIISFDDVKSDFDFLMLNSNLTTGWQTEQKFTRAFRFLQKENPKTYITCNTILQAEGSTAKRRQFILEFAPYYLDFVRRNIEPILHVHGGMFFSDDWDEDEWNRFYCYMLDCCRFYLENGLQFYKPRNVAKNKLLQLTSDDFAQWIQTSPFTDRGEFNVKELFQDFKEQYYGDDKDFKQRTFTNWLKIYAETINCAIETRRSSGVTYGKFISK